MAKCKGMNRIHTLVQEFIRYGYIHAEEGHCLVASVELHAKLEKPTTEYGVDSHQTAKMLVKDYEWEDDKK